MDREMLNRIKNKKGVSLIELLIVISIIAVMGGIAAPSFFSYQRTLRLRSASRQLASDIRFARQLAISKNTSHRLCFNGTTSQYDIYQNNACNGTKVKTVDLAQAYTGVTRTGGAALTFNPVGAVTPADTEFTLTQTDISIPKKVTVTGAGNVKIQ